MGYFELIMIKFHYMYCHGMTAYRTMWNQLKGVACNIEMRTLNLSIIDEHLPFLLNTFISSIV